jgi:hypothetical protein
MIHASSFAQTIAAANDALFFGRGFAEGGKQQVVSWVLERQIVSGRWSGTFSPTEEDLQSGVQLFTGERLRTKWGTWNVLTAEAARLLILLGGTDPRVATATGRADAWLRHACFASKRCVIGECAHSFMSYLRYLSVIETTPGSARDSVGWLYTLSQCRDGTGRWERFPFYYTLLALLEMRSEAARNELRYALPACERVRNRRSGGDVYSERRREVVERVLGVAQPL